MEGYWGRIPEDQRVTSLRLAWQDLWSKASLYMPKEDMKAVGETFVFSSEAHGSQRRYTGEPYIIPHRQRSPRYSRAWRWTARR